jgi:Bardet-Biedl syndrome 7 protein
MQFNLKGSLLIYEAEVAGPPTTLALYNGNGGLTGREVLYGTSDGKIGLMEMGLEEPIPKWELPNEKRLAGVNCLDNFDITNDGVMDLLVGREDGMIEVYGYDSMDNPTLKYTFVSF